MSEHLSEEKIKAFSSNQLIGSDYVDALEHIENCEECRNKTTLPTKAEIIEQILTEPPLPLAAAAGYKNGRAENPLKDEAREKPKPENWLQRLKNFFLKKS